jgi:hypothetical protein
VFNDRDGGARARFDCVGEQWNVFTRSPANFSFVHLNNLRALGPGRRVRFGDIGTVLKSMLSKHATRWSDVSQIGDIYVSVTSARGQNCKVFAKYGPPWQARYPWTLEGRLCGAQGRAVSDGDLQSFVSSLIVRVQS